MDKPLVGRFCLFVDWHAACNDSVMTSMRHSVSQEKASLAPAAILSGFGQLVTGGGQ
jgi:hypothetical protein